MNKIKPVTFEDLKEIFSGNKFTYRLRRAVRIATQAGCEVGFQVWRGIHDSEFVYDLLPTSDLGVSDPFNSCISPMHDYYTDFLNKKGYDPVHSNDVYPVVLFHIHPDLCVCPSLEDLITTLALRQWSAEDLNFPYNIFPLETIAAMRDMRTKDVDLLIVQDVNEVPNKIFIQDAYDAVDLALGDRTDDNGLVAEAYDSLPNFNAALLTYERQKDGLYRVAPNELSKLEKFAFTPILQPSRTDKISVENG